MFYYALLRLITLFQTAAKRNKESPETLENTGISGLFTFGTPEGTRTPDLLVRSYEKSVCLQLFTEICNHFCNQIAITHTVIFYRNYDRFYNKW